MLYRRHFYTLSILATLLITAYTGNAQCYSHLVLDNFSTGYGGDGGAVPPNSDKSGWLALQGSGILGGERDIAYTFSNPTSSTWGNSGSVSVFYDSDPNKGSFSVSSDVAIVSKLVSITYDGTDGSAGLNATTGFGATDVSSKYDGISVTINKADGLGTGNTFSISYTIYSSPTAFSSASVQFNGPASGTLDIKGAVKVPLTAFTKDPSAADPVDFTAITAVEATFKTTQAAMDFSFSNLYFNCPSLAPLPVNYGYFKGEFVNGSSQLNWATYSEMNNKGFEIQRRQENGNFITIGYLEAQKGTSNGQAQNYTFIDQGAPAGTSYYRLKQIDVDGTFQYSRTISISKADTKQLLLAVYPNPLTANNLINLTMAGNKGPVSFILSDLTGRTVQTWGEGLYGQLSLKNLNKGFYLLKAFDKATGQTAVQRVAIQ